MNKTNALGLRAALWSALLGVAVSVLAAQAANAQTTVSAIKFSTAGERTDRLIIEFAGKEPDVSMSSTAEGLVVTLGGAALGGSVPRTQAGGATLGVVQGVEASARGNSVEVRVRAKVKVWSHSAMQTRRNVVIDLVAATVQPAEQAAAVVLPVAVPESAVVPAAPVATAPVAAESAEGAASSRRRADKPCIECHEGFYAITKTKHYVRSDSRTPGSKGAPETAAECESCHGDLKAHQKTPRVKGLVPITYGKKSPAEPQNEQCLTCHQGGTRIHWQGSAHDRAKQTCSGCHRMHAPKDPVLVTETQASVCFDCHKDRRAEMHKISTHPTKSGFITCSSCHASHGSNTRASLQKPSVNQTCYQCHAEKRGPFLWEHRSAQDDCTNCHNPHGTNTPPMLKVRQPFLCQQCHQSAGHPSTQYTGADISAGASNAQRILGRACTNCHIKVHGTNHPSGARLQR